MQKNSPTEYEEQVELVEWLKYKQIKFTSTAHSTYTKSYNQKMKNWKSGLRKGFPDMIIVLPNKLLFIEMKRVKPKGTVKPEQKEWIKALDQIDNIEATVCYGAKEAINFIRKFI